MDAPTLTSLANAAVVVALLALGRAVGAQLRLPRVRRYVAALERVQVRLPEPLQDAS